MSTKAWGQKRICPCNKIKYYDLGRERLDCPECGKEIEVVNLLKPRRGRKPGSTNMANAQTPQTVIPEKTKNSPPPEEDFGIENVDNVDVETTDEATIEDDTVLIEEDNEIDPAIDVGIIKPEEEKEE